MTDQANKERLGTMPTLSQCAGCRRKNPANATCEAFPVEIPIEILRNEADHRRPFKGDQSLRWKPRSRWTKHPLT